MKKVLIIILAAVQLIIAAAAALLVYISKRPAVPENYTEKVQAGGDIEAK